MQQKSGFAITLRFYCCKPGRNGVAFSFRGALSSLTTLGVEMVAGDIQQTPSLWLNLVPS